MKICYKLIIGLLVGLLAVTPAHAVVTNKTKVSNNDTTPGFLNGKLVGGSGITLTEGSDGSNETLTVSVSGGSSESTAVGDTAEIDLTLTGTTITGAIVAASIDEAKLDASTNASLDSADSALQAEVDGSTTNELQDIFKTVATTSGTSPVADSTTDTLTLTAGTGITVTGDSSTDAITIATTITDTNTNASTICVGSTTYLDGEGNCDDISSVYAPLASPTFTGTVTMPTPFTLGAVSVLPTGTELNYVDGVTSAIQTQLNAKQATVTAGSLTNDVILEEDLKAVDAASDEECLTYETTTGDFEWQACGGAGSVEGTAVLSTGEVGGTKFLREDGDGTSSWQTIAGGGDALVANPLSQFAATTSAQFAGVISDETGTGAVVLATSPTLVTPVLGTPTSATLTNATGLPLTGLVSDTTTALGIGSINLGHASDTTIARASAGNITVEGNAIYRAGGTDVPVADGGTGRSTGTTAYALVATGTTATGAQQTLASGATTEILVGGGASALPVWTTATGSGAPVRATSPTLVTPALGTPSALVLTNATGLDISSGSNLAVTAPVVLTGDTLSVSAASTTATGIAELAIASEVDTGTDATRAITPDALAGSNLGEKSVSIQVLAGATAATVADGHAYLLIPSSVAGMNLVEVVATAVTAGTTGTMDIQLHNVTSAADILSTKITIDSTEKSSSTAATPAVINGAEDDVAANDVIRVDIDAIHTTPAAGLILSLVFRLP